MDWLQVKALTIPEGNVTRISVGDIVLWQKSESKLPEGYIELEYLESTGTQYIDLPYYFESTDEMYAKVAMLVPLSSIDKYFIAPTKWNVPIGSKFSLGGFHKGYFTYSFGSVGTSNTMYTPKTESNNNFHEYHYANKLFEITDMGLMGDVSVYTYVGPSTNLRIFYGYNEPTACRISRLWHKRNGKLLYDLVPCLDSNGVACMYDMVNKQAYYNDGTEDFVAGNKKLPSGYTNLEYIQSTGAEYINTGLTVNSENQNKIRLEIDGNFGTSNNWNFDGSGSPNRCVNLGLDTSKHLSYGKGANNVSSDYIETDLTGRHYYVVDYKNGVLKRDGIQITTWQPSIGGNDGIIFIFTYGTDKHRQVAAKKYNFKIYDDDILVFNGVPARRDSDGTLGMYDLVTDTFFTNSGTGNFIASDKVQAINLQALEVENYGEIFNNSIEN